MRFIPILFVILLVSSACSNFRMEKRRYNKGFHISFNNHRTKGRPTKDAKTTKLNEQNEVAMRQTGIPTNHGEKDSIVLHSRRELPKVEETPTKASLTINEIASKTHQGIQKAVIDQEYQSRPNFAVSETVTNQSSQKESDPIDGFWYFSMLSILPIIPLMKKRNYRIGNWASNNVLKSRMTIAGLYAIGFSSSFLLGNVLRPEMNEWMTFTALALAGAAFTVGKSTKSFTPNFNTRKVSSATLNISSFFATFAMGAQSTFQFADPIVLQEETGLPTGVKVLILLLLIVAVIFATIGVLILSCSLACSGYGVLALVVLGSGTFIVTFLGTWAALGVIRGKSRNRENVNAALITALIPLLAFLVIAGMSMIL